MVKPSKGTALLLDTKISKQNLCHDDSLILKLIASKVGLNAEVTDLLIFLENIEKGFLSLLCQLLPVRGGRGF